jgi:hypothetical protein
LDFIHYAIQYGRVFKFGIETGKEETYAEMVGVLFQFAFEVLEIGFTVKCLVECMKRSNNAFLMEICHKAFSFFKDEGTTPVN